MDYKDSLNLPKTSFPMKANLPKLEPEILKRWKKEDVPEAAADCQRSSKYILHDGPRMPTAYPYGTALNKILKTSSSVQNMLVQREYVPLGLPRLPIDTK